MEGYLKRLNIPVSYIIYKDGSTIKAVNSTTGVIDYSSINAATVINSAIDNLTAGRTWKEKVVIKGNFITTDSINIPSYTIFELIGSITLANNVNKSIIRNADQTNGNSFFEIYGGILYGNKNNQSSGHGIDITAAWPNFNRRNIIKNFRIFDIKGNGLNISGMGSQSIIEDIQNEGANRACYATQVNDSVFNKLALGSTNAAFYIGPGSSNFVSNICCGSWGGTPTDDMLIHIDTQNSLFNNIICDSPFKHGFQVKGWPARHNTFNNLRITRPLANGYDAIRLKETSVENVFTNIYIGQKGEWDDTVYTFANAIKEYDNADYNLFENVIAKDCTTYFVLVGANSRIRHAEPKTENNVLSETFTIDSIGIKTVIIPHDLAITPAVRDCYLTVVQNTAVDDWAYNMLKLVSTDTKNVTVKINISTASATVGATAKLALKVGNP